MNTGIINQYRQERNEWTPLVSFGGGQSRVGQSAGWHNVKPYGTNNTRTLGVRWRDPSDVIQAYDVAFRGQYVNYDPTDLGWEMDVKLDPSRLSSIWYRYRLVDDILIPFNEMPKLQILSIRDHLVDFGDMDLSNNPDFSHLEISTHFSIEGDTINEKRGGGYANSITFHPDAPLQFVYISGCQVPQSFVDACLTKCYEMRDITNNTTLNPSKSFLSQRIPYSPSLQYMVDELVNNYGWTGFSSY